MEPPVKSYLPSKKFIVTASIIVGLVIIGFILSGIIKRQQGKGRNADVTLGTISQQDTNKNGIPDWQDNLYALGIEQINYVDNTEYQQDSTALDPNNKTNQLAKDMYAAISSLSRGGNLDPAVKENLTEMLSAYVTTVNEPRIWTRADIKTAGNDTAAINQYVAEYSVFAELYKPAVTPVPMLESAIELDDPNGLQKSLAPLINLHKDALTGLSSMTVPERAVAYHLDIMNGIQGILTDTEAMNQYFTDPLLTFSAVLGYNEHAQKYVDAIKAINEMFFLPLAQTSSL